MLSVLVWWTCVPTVAMLTFLAVLLGAAYLYDRFVYRPFKPSSDPKRTRKLGHRTFPTANSKKNTIDKDAGMAEGDGDDDDTLPSDIDTVIIGAGQAGLSCAAVLSQHFGKRVVVLEQHEVVGGGAHTFSVEGRTGWSFDAGLHITIPPHEQILQAVCGSVEPPVPFARLSEPSCGASDWIGFSSPSSSDSKKNNRSNSSSSSFVPAGLAEAAVGVVPGPLSSERLNIEKELCRRFPRHTKALREYFTAADTVQKCFGVFIVTALLPVSLRTWILSSWLMKPWCVGAGRTAEEGLYKFFPDKNDEETNRLRSYLVGLWLDTGSPPARGSFFMQTAVMGGWQKLGEAYPQGGPQRTVLAMVDAVESSGTGSKVYIKSPVTKILLKEKVEKGKNGNGNTKQVQQQWAIGVQLGEGNESVKIFAKNVVSAVGYRVTERLLSSGPGEDLDHVNDCPLPSSATPLPPVNPEVRKQHPGLLKTKQSCSFVMANIALQHEETDEINSSEAAAAFWGISEATLWLQPASKINNFDALVGIDEFSNGPGDGLSVPLEHVPAGITFPSLKSRTEHDVGAASPTSQQHKSSTAENEKRKVFRHTCQILVPANWAWFDKHNPLYHRDIEQSGAKHCPPHLSREGQADYDEVKLQWERRLTALLHRHYPNTSSSVVFCDISTPQTMSHYLRTLGGAAIGLDVTPSRFIDLDDIRELDAKHPRVGGLWRTGQDYLMCGQVLAAVSGIVTALRMQGSLWCFVRFVMRTLALVVFPAKKKKMATQRAEKKMV